MSEKYYLGIDIGTYETKGVLVNIRGEVISQSAKKHEMIVPQSGWAEHRPIEDWWGDFTFISKDLIKKSGCDPKFLGTLVPTVPNRDSLPDRNSNARQPISRNYWNRDRPTRACTPVRRRGRVKLPIADWRNPRH